jgi:pimeloyl-ACP methyl ester carboxylesterase
MSHADGTPPPMTAARKRGEEAHEAGKGGVPQSAEHVSVESRKWSRRRILACGIGGFIGAASAGFELVDHGVLPGKQTLVELDGTCSVASPALTFAPAGPSTSGSFFSTARNRTVGYTIAYPPGHEPGSALPLVVSLHGFGGNHSSGLGGLSLSRALAARTNGKALAPMALVSVDGGGLYWNPHPGDDPMAMIVSELIPMCRRLGLGRPPHGIGAIGISMGGYGALVLAEKHPQLITAVASISPAVWTTYAEARSANAGAFASAGDFASDDVITHASALDGIPVRIASGTDDPFHPGVIALAQALPRSAVVDITQGCHDGSFCASQQHASLAFLGARIAQAEIALRLRSDTETPDPDAKA